MTITIDITPEELTKIIYLLADDEDDAPDESDAIGLDDKQKAVINNYKSVTQTFKPAAKQPNLTKKLADAFLGLVEVFDADLKKK